MGSSLLVQATKLHVFSMSSFPGNLREHDLACKAYDSYALLIMVAKKELTF